MATPPKNLPILLGILRQESASGELVLEQSDGVRRCYLSRGDLVHLKSDAVGEQFGSYLLRQGILDLPALKELLANDERYRIGEKVIQWGMMTLEERDLHLQALQEQIMIHALEHPILRFEWNPGPITIKLEQDLHFKLHHRHFVWNTFQESNYLLDLHGILESEADWRWEGRPGLLDMLADLPLTPETAFTLSFLGADPISFDTFRSLSQLGEAEAGRFLATLWALGALVLSAGPVPDLARGGEAAPPVPEPPPTPTRVDPTPRTPSGVLPPLELPGLPLIAPPAGSQPRFRLPPLELDATPVQPEFLDTDPEPTPPYPLPNAPGAPAMPPPALGAPASTPPALDLGAAAKPQPGPEPPPPRPDPPHASARAPWPGDPFFRPEASTPVPQQPPQQARPAAPAPMAPAESRHIPALPAPKPLEGPARARSLVLTATQLVRVDRTVEAVRTLEQAVKLEMDPPVAYEAWLLLGQLRMANPAWSTRSIDALQKAAQIRPKAPEPWLSMGELYLRKSFLANAAACYRRALELDPTVTVPQDVDLDAEDRAQSQAPAKKGLLSRFRSILGPSDRS